MNLKTLFAFLCIFGSVFFCRAQERILPLSKTLKDSIKSGDYLKGLDNDYKPFIGIWKAVYEDKTIVLRIIKVLKDSATNGFRENEIKYFKDVLIMQHYVMDNKNNILEDYFSRNLKVYKIKSTGVNKMHKEANFLL